MSGHSKWSTIKRAKGKTDAARGRLFTKLIKEITTAARSAGGDPETNPRLRTAILTAKGANMPADNIKKAIQKGTGELPGVAYDEVQYEAYGPAGVAILVQTLTDNRNRTVSDIRHVLSKNGGNLGETGCVGWMFHKLGQIEIDASTINEDALIEVALEAGATDVTNNGATLTVTTATNDMETVKAALEAKKIPIVQSELAMVPQTMIKLDEKSAEQMLRLMDALEEHDDVQKVYANFDIDDDILERISSQS